MAQRVYVHKARIHEDGTVAGASNVFSVGSTSDSEFLLIPAEDADRVRGTLVALLAIPGATMPGQIEEALKLLEPNK